MKLTEISIKKPIAVIMFVITAILIGAISYFKLGADLFPAANIPVMYVSVTYPGAGAEEIEKDVIKPIEDAVSGLSGLDYVSSNASEGIASVYIVFKMSADTTAAFMDTQKALESVGNELPDAVGKPMLYKIDQNAEPILQITLSGDKSLEELYSGAEKVKERVERIEGVGSTTIFGGMKKELIIKADKSKLEYYGLSLMQIVGMIKSDNLNIPGGIINQPSQDRVVRIEGEYNDIGEIKDFRIPVNEGFVRLGDIADISLDYPRAKEYSRANGKQAVGLSIQKQSDANIVETGSKVKEELDKLKPELKDLDVKIVSDSTIFITSSLNETLRNLLEGILITALVLFMFLRQWKSVSIVMVAIPTSLVATFFMMYISKFTLNMLSLMGLTLCVGILVDDSVVVLENIHRHIKMGKNPKDAALEGRSEIGMAAIAITLSDVVVFAPIAFMSGMVGQYFKQFGLVVVFATLFSLAISFTVTPMMASRFFKRNPKQQKANRFSIFMDNVEEMFKDKYEILLKICLKNRFKFLGLILVMLVLSGSLILSGMIGSEFMPYTDQGEFTIYFTLSSGANIESTDEKAKIIEKYVDSIPEKDYFFTRVGTNNLTNKGRIFVKLKDKKERSGTQKEIVERVRMWAMENMSGADISVAESDLIDMGGDDGKPISIYIKGSKTEVIQEITNIVEEKVKAIEGAIEVGNSFEDSKPSYKISIDKVASSRYGITTMDVSNLIRTGIEGSNAGTFSKDGEDYDVKVKFKEDSIKDVNDINNLNIITSMGKQVPVSQIANVTLSDSPSVIDRKDKQRVATVSANIAQGYTLGDVSAEISKALEELELHQGYTIEFGGEQEMMDDTFVSLIQVLIVSIMLVYIILVVLYESFLTPFVRILALPVGFIGAIVLLFLTGNSLNMLSMIGIIMLDGLAAKNGTILIDYTNSLMQKGMTLHDSLIEAGRTRLKPIIMTSLSMIAGMIPAALALGDGSEFKQSMAVVIIGGMLSSTILSPLLLPVAYTLIEDFQDLLKRVFKRKNSETDINII